MHSLFLVNLLDFSRAFGDAPELATPETVAKFLQTEWLGKKGGVFNYLTAMDVLVLAFAGRITMEQALAKCQAYWHTRGRVENANVVKAFWKFAEDNRSTVYPRSHLAAPVGRWRGRNIFIGIKAPLVRVQNDDVAAVMPVFRKNYVPGEKQMNLSLTAVREFCFREGYRDLDTEFIRAKGIQGVDERQLIVERGSERALYTTDQFDQFAAVYAGAVALLADSGLGLAQPNFRGYRIMNPDEPPFPGM